jgi:hypothetical protein
MSDATRDRWFRFALGFWGFGFCFVVGVGAFAKSLITPYAGAEYDQMLQSLYFTLGIFLLLAARHPFRYLSIIRFTIWSSVAHGGLMIAQALAMHGGHPHVADPATLLIETIPLVLTAVSLFLLMPPRAVERPVLS